MIGLLAIAFFLVGLLCFLAGRNYERMRNAHDIDSYFVQPSSDEFAAKSHDYIKYYCMLHCRNCGEETRHERCAAKSAYICEICRCELPFVSL